jgi:hypothetical protein
MGVDRGIGVRAPLVSRMPKDGRAVAEAEAEGLAPARASEFGARRPRRGGRAEAGVQRAGGQCAWAGGGWGVGVSVRRVGGKRRAAGAWVGSGGGGRAGRGGADLSRVRERGGQGCTAFFYKAITSVGHPSQWKLC